MHHFSFNSNIISLEKVKLLLKQIIYPGYRWEEVGEVEIIKFPRVEVPNGLHIRVSKY
jgi:hypothetical protein